MENIQKIIKDWLKKIKIHKIRKFDNMFLADKGSTGEENSI